MSNNYYTHGTYPTPNSPGSSALLRAELDLITAGFDKLPTLVIGNANRLVAVNSAGNGLTAVTTVSALDVADSGFTISDNVDTTKKAAFEASGISTGTTRVFTLPDASATLVGTSIAQTLTNKTLGAGTVISAGTIDGVTIGGTTAAAGTFTSLAATSATVGGAAVTTASNTQTLTNKTLTAPSINNPTLAGGSIDGTTIGGGTPAAGSFTTLSASSSIKLGGADVATLTGTQTLTNKTLSTGTAITAGTIDAATIGGTTPAAGTFTSVATSSLTVGGVAATTASNTQTLTNKTISGASNTISNIGNGSLTNSSVTIGSTSVSLGGTITTIAGLTLTAPGISTISNSGTLTLPAATDTLVARATTDTLTNKTMSGASNTFSNIPNTAITGLGTMSTQNASSVTITGGSITGITDLAIADGGTGASTAAAARVNLLPSYTGNALYVLRVNSLGTDVEWAAAAAGTVTSVALSGGTTGLTVSGSPITTSGTITLAGTLAVANGGTNATTAAGARANLFPSYTGNAGKAVRVNVTETDLEYFTVSGSGTVTSITAGTGLTGGTITTAGTVAIDTTVVATLSGTQTLTNKTLTTPVLSATAAGTTAGQLGYSTGVLTFGNGTATKTVVTTDDTQTLSNKTISGSSNTLSNIGNASLTNSSVTIGTTSVSLGATASALAGLNSIALRNAGTGAFDMTQTHNGTLTAGRSLTWNLNDASRSISLSGNITTAGAFTTSGAFALTLTATGATNVTLPTTGTLATLAGTETLTSKTLSTGTAITAGTIDGVTIGGTTPANGTFDALTATGNVVLGDNTADTLQIYANTVTWSGTPTHSSNHTFSGSVTINGTTTLAANGLVVGTTQLVASGGFLGVGTASPFTALHAARSITGGNPSTSGTTDANVITRLQGGSVALDLGGTASGQQWLQTRLVTNLATNYDLWLQPNGGNLIVGTVTPVGGYKLEVSGKAYASGGVVPRIGTVADAATITPTGDSSDQYNVTALAQAATIAVPSGTPVNGQKLVLRIKDNGTGRLLSWTTGVSKGYRAIGITLPTTTVANKTTYVGCIYNAADDRWDAVATVTEA